MPRPDLNLLVTLDTLLAEGSVAGAARALGLSPSAMSRALARLRESTGDPLLVRAGRGLVPTPRAIELRRGIGRIVREAEAALRPLDTTDLKQVERTFTLRTRDGFVENFGPALLARVRDEAPGIRLHFLPKLDKDNTAPLRDGSVDLETGVVSDATGPEVRAQALFRDRFVGVARLEHPLRAEPVSLRRYLAARHVLIAGRGLDRWPVDTALEASGLKREIATVVAGFSEALALVRESDLVATVPERYTGKLREALFTFPLPISLPDHTVSMLWHPRMDADAVHRWLRETVRAVCAAGQPRRERPR